MHHKKFSVFVAVIEKGHAGEALRVAHDRTMYREFLARLPARSAIAVEANASYSWLVDKTDKLDARGLAILLRNGTLPEVWIAPSELRDHANCFVSGSSW